MKEETLLSPKKFDSTCFCPLVISCRTWHSSTLPKIWKKTFQSKQWLWPDMFLTPVTSKQCFHSIKNRNGFGLQNNQRFSEIRALTGVTPTPPAVHVTTSSYFQDRCTFFHLWHISAIITHTNRNMFPVQMGASDCLLTVSAAMMVRCPFPHYK